MNKIILSLIALFVILFFPASVLAQSNFVTIVNPVRGSEFWSPNNHKPVDAVSGEMTILKKNDLPATWLVRFDALANQDIVDLLKNRPDNHELGLFLEITPGLTNAADVKYHQSQSWHSAGSVFLTGYSPSERERLIDTSFERFKNVFGFYPTSVGAWWIDSYSLEHMQNKYGITASLEVADQYSTDNYQIWGQYFGTPYYPAKNNSLIPAQNRIDMVPIVMFQWAARDPVNGYGNGVEESTYSVQANDYTQYHNLGIGYFGKLVDIYTKQSLNQFNQLTVGLENSYSWERFGPEYSNQIRLLEDKSKSGQFSITNMSEFAQWYQNNFLGTSPPHIIVANDPLGTNKTSVWFMDNYYRAGWFYNENGSAFRDIRQYINGSEELCLKQSCDSINFATSATRVLDDVSFNQSWLLDPGLISNIRVEKADNFILTYDNEAGKKQAVEFLPRDLSFDSRVSTIDGTILNATKVMLSSSKKLYIGEGTLRTSVLGEFINAIKFMLFVFFGIFLPGRMFVKENFLAPVAGLIILTFFSLIAGFLGLWWLIYLFIAVFAAVSLRQKFNFSSFSKVWILILAGSVFQVIPTIKSGLLYDFGIGYWGPNGHDGIWHLALINQILKGVPPQSPILSGEILKNYHYLYDLLVAATSYLLKIPPADLLFRFYPIFTSILIGWGSYLLIKKLFNSTTAFLSLFFIYFAGSFGWIVELIKHQGLGGESDFWANQAISLNLNPPFAISLVFVLAILHLILIGKGKRIAILLILIAGSLVEFKSYAGLLVLLSLTPVSVYLALKKDYFYLICLFGAGILTAVFYLANTTNQQFFIFYPFWLIHSMIDFPDRVGWVRLSTARVAYQERGEWLKFILAEVLGLVIFVVGNLGVRVISLFSFSRIPRRSNTLTLYLFTFLIISFIIPILFIQTGTNWNTIQFFYYFIFVAALLAGVSLERVYRYLSGYIGFVLVSLVLILGSLNSLVTASTYLVVSPHTFISNDEYQGLMFLSEQPDGVVLTYPYDSSIKGKIQEPRPLFAYDTTAYIGAYSGKSVFVEDEVQNQILQTDYLKRLVESRDFYQGDNLGKRKFLVENRIKYIYDLKFYQHNFDEKALNISNIFDNNEVTLYRVN